MSDTQPNAEKPTPTTYDNVRDAAAAYRAQLIAAAPEPERKSQTQTQSAKNVMRK